MADQPNALSLAVLILQTIHAEEGDDNVKELRHVAADNLTTFLMLAAPTNVTALHRS